MSASMCVYVCIYACVYMCVWTHYNRCTELAEDGQMPRDGRMTEMLATDTRKRVWVYMCEHTENWCTEVAEDGQTPGDGLMTEMLTADKCKRAYDTNP